jgi:ribonucleoside-triphosphate reductase|nr:MAG TPA: anaerobic ribonucleoside triphosphate reductase [Crassvirales sp.]
MKVIKRVKKGNGSQLEEFDLNKIINAVKKAYSSQDKEIDEGVLKELNYIPSYHEGASTVDVETIQNEVEKILMDLAPYDVARAYIIYREKHNESRLIRERIDYMNSYSSSSKNASSSSETDANANVSMKNVANLEGEVYKTTNRVIQRQRMKDKLYELYPDIAKQYEEDLKNHIIYTHDEASTPVLKPYCMAVTLYPLMTEGVGNIDGVTPTAPNDIASFSGQVTNLAFLLSSQCKGAVAFGDYFVAFNYYVVKEFGEIWYEKLDCISTSEHHIISRTIKDSIEKGMKQFIWGVNQPAGNRSYNSPFTNVSWYDKYYFKSLFEGFYYPDGSKPKWKQIDTLQRMFMELMREIRLIKPITFPVTTMALVHNNKEYLDNDYKELCAEEWAKGGSFFCYTSDNPSSLASCCRVLNEMSDNTFSSTTGMTGVMTGSCNVITLNINRIVQDWFKNYNNNITPSGVSKYSKDLYPSLKWYLQTILDRVYKYHIAFKTMLYELEDKGMLAASNGGYIYIKKLYSTIGVIGYTEAAQFLGLEISNNEKYKEFLQLILGTIKEQNKIHSIKDKKRPFLFNSEAVPGEGLGIKLYNWDKKDNYIVPENQNLYNCYFYNPWTTDTSVLDKIKLHGKDINNYTDGGQACHLNLDTHLSKEQYLKLLDVAKDEGCNYFTFNIPISECKKCHHVVNAPIKRCPICNSEDIKYYTRIIGYLTAVDNWSTDRQEEFKHRKYYH